MAKLLYDEMSWLEVKEAVEQQRVPLIPVGSTEQHGPHLPTKTDAFLRFNGLHLPILRFDVLPCPV